SPSFDFHSAMSACIETSVGIQWLLQAARYFSQAQRYLSGRSWFTSARALIIALSSTRTRAPSRSIAPSPVPSAVPASVAGATFRGAAGALLPVQSSMLLSPLAPAYWHASQVGSSIAQAWPEIVTGME